MNFKIMQMNGEVFVETDKGVIKVDGENVKEVLELENYLDYLKSQKIQFKRNLYGNDFSDTKIIDIIKHNWKSGGVVFKMLPLLEGIMAGFILIPLIFVFAFNTWLAFPTIIKVILFLVVFFSGAGLSLYTEAKSEKNKSKEYHRNIKIAEEQIEIVEKELEKANQILKTHCPIVLKEDTEKLPEIEKLNTFKKYLDWSYSYIVTTDDEPVNGLIRRLNR